MEESFFHWIWVDTSPPFRLKKYTDLVTKALCLWSTICWAKFKERLAYGECNVLSTNWKIALHYTTQACVAHSVKWRAELPCFDAQYGWKLCQADQVLHVDTYPIGTRDPCPESKATWMWKFPLTIIVASRLRMRGELLSLVYDSMVLLFQHGGLFYSVQPVKDLN